MYLAASQGFGLSLNPIKAIKSVAHAAVHPVSTVRSGASAVAHPIRTAHAVVHSAAQAADDVGHALKVGVLKPAEWVASGVTAPIRNRVHTLRDRRAAKLAWDARRSRTPTAQEHAQAKSWTKSYLKRQGPQGYLLALFAGAPQGSMFGEPYPAELGVEPATLTVIAASIPVFMALMNAVLNKTNKSGEAPADPSGGAGGGGAAAAAAQGPAAAGTVDLQPAQDAAADAMEAGADAVHGKSGNKLFGLPKKYVYIGGAVAGGLVLILLLTGKKS